MKTRWLAGSVIVAAAIFLTYGMGFAAGRTGPTQGRGDGQWTSEDMDRMHEQMQGWMQQHMGADAAAQCDEMHDQMRGMMDGSGPAGMMGPNGAGMQQHHPGGMMSGFDPASGGPGGMMGGPGSGMMGGGPGSGMMG
jgi:hypothetical protein